MLVTGATGGIGQAISKSVKDSGARLVLTGRRKEALQRVSAQLAAESIQADLRSGDGLAKVLEAIGSVDVLVANAGLPASGHVTDFGSDDLDDAIAVNLRAPMAMARAAAKSMGARGHGHIVFIGSIGSRMLAGDTAVYNGTKFGLRGFALALREDLRGSGVGVSIVEPGFISEAGMFADSGLALPRGFRALPPARVGDAVVRAIRDDVGELVVAPWEMRIAVALGGLAPVLSSRIQRWAGLSLDYSSVEMR
ncbi:SDR family NAD(P)-dependent oxidoreductase [Nocardia blacklockiae]|nr:SDR family NAD(P)-dependent oxidoreductase [Nocardia blacklockiae]